MNEGLYLEPTDLGYGHDYTPRGDHEVRLEKLPITVDQLEELVSDNPKLQEELTKVLDICLEYAKTVTGAIREHEALSKGDSSEQSFTGASFDRRKIHDDTIRIINTFWISLQKAGKDATWIKDFNGDRAKYGRFAILISLSRMRLSTQKTQ